MATISTPRYLIDQTRRRLTPTLQTIPGMGLLLLDAVSQRDYPIITGVFLIVGVAVMFINLIVDLSYGLLDPKVRYR